MEDNRLALREILLSVMRECKEEPHLYYQPDASMTLRYPCILYHLKTFTTRHADDNPYFKIIAFDITYVTRSPVSKVPTQLLAEPGFVFDRYYTAENLHHYAFTFTDTLKEV